jgi:hypothetical protein
LARQMQPKLFRKLDVRSMIAQGIEPFPAIRAEVEGLKPEEGLQVIAPFLPSPLIERLAGDGFQSRIERGNQNCWVVYFWRESAG